MSRLPRPLLALAAGSSALLLSGCGETIADWNCDRIAEKSTELSKSQPIRFDRISDVREESRTTNDARCTGRAELEEGGSGEIHMRAYVEGSNIMVAYQGEPFD